MEWKGLLYFDLMSEHVDWGLKKRIKECFFIIHFCRLLPVNQSIMCQLHDLQRWGWEPLCYDLIPGYLNEGWKKGDKKRVGFITIKYMCFNLWINRTPITWPPNRKVGGLPCYGLKPGHAEWGLKKREKRGRGLTVGWCGGECHGVFLQQLSKRHMVWHGTQCCAPPGMGVMAVVQSHYAQSHCPFLNDLLNVFI